MSTGPSTYPDLGVRRVINGVGTRTQVGGATLRDGVAEAMANVADENVYIGELQGRASEIIAEATGADAGYVTPGAAAGMLLAAAACIAGDDYETMARLPDTDGIASEIAIPKAHRIKYDIGLRASGATLRDVGHVSHHPINGGVEKVEPWQLDAAITEETVAVAYVQRPHNLLPLRTVVEVAHDNDVPVIVDAASEVPPEDNLRRFLDVGADLVSFSGGKGIGGPQPSGFLAGRQDLIRSVALQHLPDGYHEELWDPPASLIERSTLPRGTPRTGLGRPLKVGPTEVVGLLVALEGFLAEDHEERLAVWRTRAESIAEGLEDSPHLDVSLSSGIDKASGVPKVIGRVRESAPISVIELLQRLRAEDPRIWLGERRVSLDEFTVSVQQLTDDEAEYIVERINSTISGGSG